MEIVCTPYSCTMIVAQSPHLIVADTQLIPNGFDPPFSVPAPSPTPTTHDMVSIKDHVQVCKWISQGR
jgi:hypothetical protein